jgi:hypothetical protein
MEPNVNEEAVKLANDFIQRFIRLMLDKKKTDVDVKYLKREFNELGLPTQDVLKAFRLLRQEKKNVGKAEQVETFKEWLEENEETKNLILELNSPSD